MTYEEIKDSLSDPATVSGNSFGLLREISQYVNATDTHNQGRDLVIRALAVKEHFTLPEHEILTSLVRSVGLFPYMSGDLESADFDDYLAYELHRAEHLGDEVVFHSLQAKIFHLLISGANVVLSASTSVGKSLVTDALIASGRYKNVVVVVPTLALIDEIRRRFSENFGSRCAIITHATQNPRIDRINVFILTQERVLSRRDLDKVDLFVVDEFYKVDLSSDSDSSRAVDLNLAFQKLAKTRAQFYLLGPNIQSVSGLAAYEYHFIPSEFSTVAVDIIPMALPTRGNQRANKLVELCRTFDGPTIVYCQSPRSASDVAEILSSSLDLPILEETADAVAWISANYDSEWNACSALQYGIGVHHGGVPRALQQFFIRLFNERKIPFLVCTSTIIEGVNTVAKNVVIYDRRKRQDVLDHFTYKNIVGRAARMNQYFVGKVYVLEAPPDEQDFAVEFPIGAQDADTPFSLLLELDQEDLAPMSRDRLERLFETSSLSQSTIRLNRHISPAVQEAIAKAIREREAEYKETLTWRGLPSGPELETTCELIFDFLEQNLLRDYGVFSGSQLAWHLNKLRIERDLSAYVRYGISNRLDHESVSESVERSLKFVRNVVCQRFPRDLMVIEAIQKDVFSVASIQSGEYGLFAEQAENLFLPRALFALDEYGIPIQTAQRLASRLLPAESLDEVLTKLVRLPVDELSISVFEQTLLKDVTGVVWKVYS